MLLLDKKDLIDLEAIRIFLASIDADKRIIERTEVEISKKIRDT